MSGLAKSPRRVWAIFIKELVQMRRDRLTFAMIIGGVIGLKVVH